MKKKLLIFLSCFIAMFTFLNTSCSGKIPSEIQKKLSEVRTGIYEITTDTLTVNVITGERENPYVINGTAAGMIAYTVITIIPSNSEYISENITYNYVLKTGKKDYSGAFTLHPFGNSYSAEINEQINAKSLELKVTANKDDWNFNESIVLESVVSDDMINWQDALLIGMDALKDTINPMYTKKVLNAEVYVKLLCDPLGKTKDHYWYVAFANGEKIASALIEPVSKEILALRNE